MVQAMLEEKVKEIEDKEREIDLLTQELTQKPTDDESVVRNCRMTDLFTNRMIYENFMY